MTIVLCICKHTPYFYIRTDIITFMVSPVSIAERIVVDIDRTKLVACPGNLTYKDIRAVNLLNPYVRFVGQTYAYLSFIVGTVPKVLFVSDDGFFR